MPKRSFKYIAFGIGFVLIFLAVQTAVTAEFSYGYSIYSIFKDLGRFREAASGDIDTYSQYIESTEQGILDEVMLISLITDMIILIILLFWAVGVKRNPLKEVGLVKTSGLWWPVCIVLGLSMNLAVTGLLNMLPIPDSMQTGSFFPSFNSSNDYGIFFMAVTILAPITEEVVFRGLAYERFKRGTSMLLAAVLSATLFGVVHGSLIQGSYAFILGLIQCVVFERCRSLWAPVMVHLGFNFCGFIFALIPNLPSTAVLTLMLIAGLAFALAMLLYILIMTEKPKAPGFMPSAAGNHYFETENPQYVR